MRDKFWHVSKLAAFLRVRQAVFSQLIGAITRAILVALLVATPTLILPGVSESSRELAMVIALVLAAVTLFEYGSSHPGLIEFRFAPPFNRIRFVALFTTVFLLALMMRQGHISEVSQLAGRIGLVVGNAMDFPFSPVRVMTELLTKNAPNEVVMMVRSAAGLSYIISLVSLAFFMISMRLLPWPLGDHAFNIWVNLPTFDSVSSADIEQRLIRDARVNIILGFTLPFLGPLVAQYVAGHYQLSTTNYSQTLIWTVAIWAFLPASLFMRGMAMGKLARMIKRKRQRLYAERRGSLAFAA